MPFFLLSLCLLLGGSAFAQSSVPLSTAPMAPPSAAAASPSPVEPHAGQKITLDDLKGNVLVKKTGQADFTAASNRTVLETGDEIQTQNGSGRLVFEDKSEITLGPNTRLAITESLKDDFAKTRSTVLKMELGKLKAKITKLTPGSRFEVITPSAIASVRGTVFYLNSAQGNNNQNFTDIYVDESDKGVLFTNIQSDDSYLVSQYSESNAAGDGTTSEPRELSEEEQDAYQETWEDLLDPSNSTPDNTADGSQNTDNLSDPTTTDSSTNDAALDRLSEQNISGDPVNDTANETFAAQTQREEERLLISTEIARIRTDQDFAHADANLAQISDAQTGKVFTDVHGNRVRVDQYVFHDPGSPKAQFLSLTLRSGAYQNGVSSVLFGAEFNSAITQPLRDLPWSDYLNSVSSKGGELAGDNLSPYSEFVVHESYGNAAAAPAFFPRKFFAEFTNPAGDRQGRDKIRFEEQYSGPFKVLNSPQGQFWIQGRVSKSTSIQQFNGDTLLASDDVFGNRTLLINGQSQAPSPNSNPDGSQTTSFASSYIPGRLETTAGINYYRNLPINSNANPTDDEHPAYFEERYGADKVLLGIFVPINDAGQVIDVPGFRPEGLRSVVFPHPLVNGGNYNLEIILLYGYKDASQNFVENFRIDTIITPEIFTSPQSSGGLGLPPNSSQAFPPSLHPDADDYPPGSYGV